VFDIVPVFGFLVLTPEAAKLVEWNKTLSTPLSESGLAKLVKGGFTSPNEIVQLLGEEELIELDLSLRDKAIIKKLESVPQS